jgi:hypothetical protein
VKTADIKEGETYAIKWAGGATEGKVIAVKRNHTERVYGGRSFTGYQSTGVWIEVELAYYNTRHVKPQQVLELWETYDARKRVTREQQQAANDDRADAIHKLEDALREFVSDRARVSEYYTVGGKQTGNVQVVMNPDDARLLARLLANPEVL